MSDIDVRVKAIIGEVLERQPHTIGDRATAEELGTDSLGFFDISVAVEDEFQIEFTDEQIEGVPDVGALVALVERLAGPFTRRER